MGPSPSVLTGGLPPLLVPVKKRTGWGQCLPASLWVVCGRPGGPEQGTGLGSILESPRLPWDPAQEVLQKWWPRVTMLLVLSPKSLHLLPSPCQPLPSPVSLYTHL